MAPNSVVIIGSIPGLINSRQEIFCGLFALTCALLALSVFLFLCSICDRPPEDDVNLLSVLSDKETNSFPSISRNELPANGHTESLTNGDVLSDQSTIINSSEDALLPVEADQDTQSKSSKCPQSRELPQIPSNGPLPSTEPAEVNEAKILHGVCNTYEVLKVSSSQDIIIEDSLYETVKELKEESGSVTNEIYGQADSTDLNIPEHDHNHENADGAAAYATVSKVKMNRSISTEQRLIIEDDPPPLPIKQLDENTEAQNGKFQDEDSSLTQAEMAAMYSTVSKSVQPWFRADTEQEAGYACIDEVTPGRFPSTPNHLYASVSDYEGVPAVPHQNESALVGGDDVDPGYEAIRALREVPPEQKAESTGEQSTGLGENDYENIRGGSEIVHADPGV
ncbi:phosphoprotein associated with glycosphingolipid-enriched microdomains 1 [Rhinoraja longicauda]